MMPLPGGVKPISISGQDKAAWASYSAGGLVFLDGIDRAKVTTTAPSSQAEEAAEDGWNNMHARLVQGAGLIGMPVARGLNRRARSYLPQTQLQTWTGRTRQPYRVCTRCRTM
jgi:hypothetical protein